MNSFKQKSPPLLSDVSEPRQMQIVAMLEKAGSGDQDPAATALQMSRQLGDMEDSASAKQFALYRMNRKLIEEGDDYQNHGSVVFSHLRRLLCQESPVLDYGYEARDPASFMTALKKLLAEHPANNHALFERFKAAKISERDLRRLIGNYIPIAETFHLTVIALCYHVPLKYRVNLAHNFFEEMGDGHYEKSHPLKYRRISDRMALGGYSPNIETMSFFNEMVRVFQYASPAIGMGAYTALEVAVAEQLDMVGQRLGELGFVDNDREFFHEHGVIDKDHATKMLDLIEEYAGETQAYARILDGAHHMLDARQMFFSGVLREIHADETRAA